MKRVGVIPRLMLIASLVALGLGIAFWLRSAPVGEASPGRTGASTVAAAEPGSDQAAPGRGVDPRLVSGLTGTPRSGGPPPTESDQPGSAESAAADSPRSADAGWSATLMRIGGSFTAAFIVAFLLRSFVRIGLVVAAIVAGGLYLLERTGVIGVDWTMFQRGAEDAAEWVGDRSDEVWAFLKTAVPSGTAAAVGFWSGFRRG